MPKNSQTIGKKAFLNETLKESAPFWNETVRSLCLINFAFLTIFVGIDAKILEFSPESGATDIQHVRHARDISTIHLHHEQNGFLFHLTQGADLDL